MASRAHRRTENPGFVDTPQSAEVRDVIIELGPQRLGEQRERRRRKLREGTQLLLQRRTSGQFPGVRAGRACHELEATVQTSPLQQCVAALWTRWHRAGGYPSSGRGREARGSSTKAPRPRCTLPRLQSLEVRSQGRLPRLAHKSPFWDLAPVSAETLSRQVYRRRVAWPRLVQEQRISRRVLAWRTLLVLARCDALQPLLLHNLRERARCARRPLVRYRVQLLRWTCIR